MPKPKIPPRLISRNEKSFRGPIIHILATIVGTCECIELPVDLGNKLKPQLLIGKEEYNQNPPHEKLVMLEYGKIDVDGQWSWGVVRDWRLCPSYNQIMDDFHDIYHNKKTWGEVKAEKRPFDHATKTKDKHVYYMIYQLAKEAQNRIAELKLEDFERVFRFRMNNNFRIYGVTLGNNFIILWHDPDHNIYPIDD